MTAAQWPALPPPDDDAPPVTAAHDLRTPPLRLAPVIRQMPARRADTSPFTAVEAQFRALSDAGVLALPASTLGHRDGRPVPLTALRDLLLDRDTTVDYEERDRMLDVVLTRARAQPDPWLLGVVGLLLPGLRHERDRIERHPTLAGLRRHPALQNELQAELVTALMEAARARAPGQPKVARGLLNAASAAGRAFARTELAARAHANLDDALADPETLGYRPPASHNRGPLDVLHDATDANVVHPDDATLIAATRLARQPLPDLAQQLGIPYHTLRKRRERAEARLHAWLTQRDTDGRQKAGGAGGRPRHHGEDRSRDEA